ncbi:hypothetical protein EI94DRAFT_1773466 [Lactarius quietus]|nr:hypothetical protein EI94DRAFT_1773466 [Lactarius quietus]
MTVVDRFSVYEIGVSWCHCSGAPKHKMQLMMSGLFLATSHNPKTAFTFHVLEDFHLDNLECKTTPNQFFSHQRRLTNDEFPNTVPDQYQELLRVCQQWRVLMSQKKFGFGYGGNEEEKPGSMAVFGALCAQPGINNLQKTGESFIMDGNFPAEHMTMRNPENDIPLFKGTGFMLHLQSASERQQALNFNMEGIEAALIFYDVICQWSVHMMRRVNGSNYLKLPDNLRLRLVIGLFHIHGHQDICLARYSPSFIKGGQQIDGKTIKSLWTPLNEITRSTRGMSTSHCQEVIDDHMNDSK